MNFKTLVVNSQYHIATCCEQYPKHNKTLTCSGRSLHEPKWAQQTLSPQNNEETAICPEPAIIQALDPCPSLENLILHPVRSPSALSSWSPPVKLSLVLIYPKTTGTWPTVTCTSKIGCTFPHMNNKPLYDGCMTFLLQDMLDASGPRPCWNETSDGQAYRHLSILLSQAALYANETKQKTTTPLIPSHPPHLCSSNSSQLTWLWTCHPWTDMIYWWLWSTTALQRR